MSVEYEPGDPVETPDGEGQVRNVVRAKGAVVTVLVELEKDREKQPLWRTYQTGQLVPIAPRLGQVMPKPHEEGGSDAA